MTEGWFPVQNLKINRARPVKRADGEHRPLQMGVRAVGLRNAPAGAEPSGRRIGFAINPVEPYMTRSRNGQDRSLQNIL